MNHKRHALRRNIDLLAWNAFFAELRLYYPVAVLAFQAVSGSFSQAMSVFAVMNVAQALLEVPTGVFSDKYGRRLTLILGSCAEVLGALCVALAFSVNQGVWMLYAAALCVGLANAMFTGNNDALIYETLRCFRRAKETAKMIGRVNAMGQIGLAASGILASLCLLGGLTYQNLMVISFFPVFISLLATFYIVEPSIHGKRRLETAGHLSETLKLIVHNPQLRALAIASSLKSGMGVAAHNFVPAFIGSVWPAWGAPLYRSAQNGLGAAGFWFSGRVAKMYGLMRALMGATLYSYIVSGIAYVMASFVSPFLLLTTQFSYAVGLVADATLKQESFSAEQRSTMGSVISFAGSIVAGVGAIGAGLLADYFGPSESLLILLLLTAPVMSFYYKLYNATKLQVA